MFTGWKPAPRHARDRVGEVGDLERHVVRAGAVPGDEAREEVVLVDRPRLEELDGHAVAVAGAEPHLHRAKADRLTAEEDGAAEVAREEAQRVGGVGRGERDVVEVVAVGHERGRLGDGCRPAVPPGRRTPERHRPARVNRFARTQPMAKTTRPATASRM